MSARQNRLADGAGFAVAFLLCFAVAWLGAVIAAPPVAPWHAALHKPGWNPPRGLLRPVWTLLYALMAVAAGLVWRQRARKAVALPLLLFVLQLGLNLGWVLFFFGTHRLGLASGEILLLDLFAGATVFAFWHVSRMAAYLLAPYFVWVLFATALCWRIWRLNG